MGLMGLRLCFIEFVLMMIVSSSGSTRSVILAEQQNFIGRSCFSGRGNFTANSTYQENLDSIVSSFSNTTVDGGFYSSSAGEVNAMALCRGDLSPDDCRTCIYTSTRNLRSLCPNNKEAIIYYDTCSFRYSSRSIFGISEFKPSLVTYNTENFIDVNQAIAALPKLLSGLRDRASASGPLRKYATGEAALDHETIYALVQCTPDLEDAQCADCLFNLNATAISKFEDLVKGKHGASFMGPSCNLRYATHIFYETSSSDDAPAPSLSPLVDFPSPQSGAISENGKNNKKRIGVLIAVPTVVAIILISCIFCICTFIVLRIRKPKNKVESMEELMSIESSQFDLNSIKLATDNFSDANKLGDVYKGKLLNGQVIAVKRLSKNSIQGEQEFENEVLLVSQLQHRNLVRLLGFCLEGNEKVTIYELVPKGSLDHFIFDPAKRSQLNWERRYKIIEGIARGLLYLHEDSRLRVIHRNLKASNILLDEEMNPRIAGFGFARMSPVCHGEASIVVESGYMAPECARHSKNFSNKSDVYSFGVLVLEVTSGQKNSHFPSEEGSGDLPNYAWKSWSEGTISNFIDPALRPSTEIRRCIQIALLCVQENVVDRPTMGSVLPMLSTDSVPLPIPSRPPFFVHEPPGEVL